MVEALYMDKDVNWNKMNYDVFGILAFLSWRILNICVVLSESKVDYVMCMSDGVSSTRPNERNCGRSCKPQRRLLDHGIVGDFEHKF